MQQFYLVRLLSAEGELLASEEVWNLDGQPLDSAEASALDACTFFASDEHGQDPDGCTVQLFGPFDAATPAHVFTVAESDAEDAWTVTPA